MPHRLLRVSWRARLSILAPRVVALLWAAYNLSRAYGYWGTSPPQLQIVANIMPLWVPWMVVSVLLVAGALVPPQMPPKHHSVARAARQWGMSLTAGVLLVWAVAFFAADAARGFMSGGSYLMLMVSALAFGTIASREVVSVKAVKEAETDAATGLGR